jgi:hypothetical protein
MVVAAAVARGRDAATIPLWIIACALSSCALKNENQVAANAD